MERCSARIPEVFDCWFESGSMPYAQNHYPFENKERAEKRFPADFIAEGLDQTRGWFYTLTVLAAALFDQPAFKNVIVNGIILAEDGNKMSKRLKNYPDPELVINQYGADAIRLYLLNSPAVNAEDLRFSERGVELVLRQVLIPLWNSLCLLSTYAKIYNWQPANDIFRTQSRDRPLDLLAAAKTDAGCDRSDWIATSSTMPSTPFVGFIDQLTNWYIRRCRSRFWSEDASHDRDEAFETLYTVLIALTKIAAPFVPFHQRCDLPGSSGPKICPHSVHLCDFPAYHEKWRDELLEKEMALCANRSSALGHGLRKEHKLKVRQPLAKAYVISSDPDILQSLRAKQNLIADELNVKEVEFESNEAEFVSIVAKANFRVLGKKVGKLMNAAQSRHPSFAAIEAVPAIARRALSRSL